MKLDHNGYTLVEMSVVLLIIAVICSISVGSFKNSYDAQMRNDFIRQLQLDLYFAQQLAISKKLTSTVIFLNGSKKYVIRQGEEVVLTRDYPSNTTFLASTLSLNDIAFLSNGNARRSGTLLITINDATYKLVLLLGKGRFYVEKL